MVAKNQPLDMMDRMVAARYAPLVLPQPLNALPGGDYQKYLPRFNGQGETTAEEHWDAFLSYADIQNIEAKDVWMRMFIHNIYGEVRKWFGEFPVNSITIIEELQYLFMRKWGYAKYHTYYIIEFGALRRKKDETIADFSKRFNKMYGIILVEIKPLETSTKIIYANAFDHEFSLLLRETRPVTLLNMQEATLEVESNILASNRLKGKSSQ